MPSGNYPATAEEVLEPPVRFKRMTVDLIKQLASERPYRIDTEKFKELITELHVALDLVYNKQTELVFADNFAVDAPAGSSGSSHYTPAADRITLEGKASIVTYLHEYAHSLYGGCERRAVRWSLNLFRVGFPRSFARMNFRNHVAVRRER